MKKLLIVLFVSLLTTGCTSAIYTATLSRPRHDAYRIQRTTMASPVGRWDNVMMLEAGTPLKVLTVEGVVVTGRFVSASNKSLRLDAPALGVLAVTDVMRVDRVGTAINAVVRNGATGAAFGAAVAGVAGLMFGVAPPPRVFAGAAMIGAYEGAADAAREPGPGTIYVAPSPSSSGEEPEEL